MKPKLLAVAATLALAAVVAADQLAAAPTSTVLCISPKEIKVWMKFRLLS